MGGPISMKNNVVPHIFDCQPERTNAQSKNPRSGFTKLNRKREIAEILSETNVENSQQVGIKLVKFGPNLLENLCKPTTAAGVSVDIPNHTPSKSGDICISTERSPLKDLGANFSKEVLEARQNFSNDFNLSEENFSNVHFGQMIKEIDTGPLINTPTPHKSPRKNLFSSFGKLQKSKQDFFEDIYLAKQSPRNLVRKFY